MKVCNTCGEEHNGLDGENHCQACRNHQIAGKRAARAKANRETRADVMRSLGLVKVRGAMGGTYWE